MPEDQTAVATPPAPAPAPSAVQAPATPAVPVETKTVTPPAPVAPVAVAPPTEQLLAPVTPKPTVEALKLPKEHFVPKEQVDAIVSQSKTIEEAQSRFDLAQNLYADGVKRLETQNQTWLQELKGDAELGGAKWDETKALYNAGVRRLFGDKFAETLIKAKLESMPDLVRGIVRAERAAGVKPIPKGEGTPQPPTPKKPHELVYGPDKEYNANNPKAPNVAPRF